MQMSYRHLLFSGAAEMSYSPPPYTPPAYPPPSYPPPSYPPPSYPPEIPQASGFGPPIRLVPMVPAEGALIEEEGKFVFGLSKRF